MARRGQRQQQQQGGQRGAQQNNPPQQAVSWEMKDVYYDAAMQRLLPLSVRVVRGKNAAAGVDVDFWGNSKTTDATGAAGIEVSLRPEDVGFTATVTIDNKQYSTVLTVPPPKLEVTHQQGGGFISVTVKYSENNVLLPATLHVWSTNGSELAWCDAGKANWQTFTDCEIPLKGGRGVIWFKLQKLVQGFGGDYVNVAIKDRPIQSEPIYLSGVK